MNIDIGATAALATGVALGGVGLYSVKQVLNLRRVVPTNMVHIVQVGNQSISYGTGQKAGNAYYAWPSWIPKIGSSVIQLPLSVFGVELKNYDAYDQNRVPFLVDIKAFFRISDSAKAAQFVQSFAQLQSDLRDVLQGVVRRILGQTKLEDIMEARSELSEKFTAEVTDQLEAWGIETAKVIEFMNIQDAGDSQVIENIMAKEQSRIEKESRIAVAENEREAQEKEIEAERQVNLQKQDAEQQVGIRTAEKEQKVGIEREKAQQEIKAAARVTAERDADVQKVSQVRSAEIAKDVAVVRAKQDQEVKTVNAEADRQVREVAAEAEKNVTVVTAEGKLEASKRDAEGIATLGKARAEAEQALAMVPVNAQVELAEKIGNNKEYQGYMIQIEQVKVAGEVGKAMAVAMEKADIKIIAGQGADIQGSVGGVMDMFTAKGGMNLTGMLASLAATDEGKALVGRLTGAAKAE